ncbi:MAG TPA: hypothetical protein VIS06_14195 [Mycobacteriales bacterium]|jgi:hypothetical protein
MTVATKPVAIQAGGENAVQFRRAFQALFGRPGIIAPTDLDVTAKGTPDMSVNVAAGQVVVAGTESAGQGYYVVYNDATINLAVAASDPTNARIDLIVAKVQDQEYSGTVDAASIVVVTGTAAATPSAPTAPKNSITLAQIAVAANANSVTNADITDKRVFQGAQQSTKDVVVASGTSSVSTTVTFDVPFADTPHLTIVLVEAAGGSWTDTLTAISPTGFTVKVAASNGATVASSHTVTVSWRAV